MSCASSSSRARRRGSSRKWRVPPARCRCGRPRCGWWTKQKQVSRRSIVSLLWRNKQLRIGLAPDRIYVSGGRAIELAVTDGSWQAPVEALAASLGGMKGEAAVVLADQFVRYALLPYNETLKTREQWAA